MAHSEIKRVGVTGATGHLGQFVMAELQRCGYQTLAISRHWQKTADSNSSQGIALDLSDAKSVEAAGQLLEIDAMVHLAGYIPDDTNENLEVDAEKTLTQNVGGMLHLLTALKTSRRLKSFVYASSFEVYGVPNQPLIDESHSTEPLSFYGASKLAGEKYLSIFSADGVHCTSLRFPAIYGPGDRLRRAIGNFIASVANEENITVCGDGSDRRDLIYVADAARAIVLCLDKPAPAVLNIGSGGFSILEMAQAAQSLGRDLKIITAEQAKAKFDYVLNSGLAQKTLNWSPQISLLEGMRQQLRWYQSLPEHANCEALLE